MDPLYIVTAISNPRRYQTRYKLYLPFEKMVRDAGGILYTAELAYGERPFEVTSPNDPFDIQIRTDHELWHKENLLNIAMSRLPLDWKYVAWLDADIAFARPDWVKEIVHLLQHYDFIQVFSHAIDLGPEYEPLQTHKGFVYSWWNKLPSPKGYLGWHPGFGWAARREALDKVGGLIDWAILGSADRHMAGALIGRVEDTYNTEVHPNYKLLAKKWEKNCTDYIHQNIGFMPGSIFHYWHGKKADRRYSERWKILTETQYDPLMDLKKDTDLVWQLEDENIQLRDDIRRYFMDRNEDSIDL